MARIQVKVYYVPSKEIRRFTFTENQLNLSVLREMILSNTTNPVAANEIILKYKDNEGDWITLGSDEELLDAQAYSDPTDSILRVQAIVPSKKECPFKEMPRVHVEEILKSVNAVKDDIAPVLQSAFASVAENPKVKEVVGSIKDTMTKENAAHIGRDIEGLINDFMKNANLNSIINDVLASINVRREPQSQPQPSQPQPQPTQPQPHPAPHHPPHHPFTHHHRPHPRPPHYAPGPHADFWEAKPKMNVFCFSQGINNAIAKMDKKEFGEAEVILNHLAASHPENNLVYYNLACLYSITGKQELAIENLQKAVAFGYSNVEWMKKDQDLENIRHVPAFIEIVERLSPRPAPIEDFFAVPSPQPSPIHEPESVPVPEPQPVSDLEQLRAKYSKELDLLHDMGLSDDEKSLMLLKKWNGNINRVVNESFSFQI